MDIQWLTEREVDAAAVGQLDAWLHRSDPWAYRRFVTDQRKVFNSPARQALRELLPGTRAWGDEELRALVLFFAPGEPSEIDDWCRCSWAYPEALAQILSRVV